MRIIVGISGASGAVYGLELLRHLHAGRHEVHAVVSDYGWKVLQHECGVDREQLRPLVHSLHDNDNLAAPIASGSFKVDAMIVAPCSMRSLAAIASGLAGNLLCRAADVVIKERKRLLLVVRETPLSPIHLENMLKLARIGVGIMPACPGFYHCPGTIGDLVSMMVGRMLDGLGIENECFTRWGEEGECQITEAGK